MTELTPKQEAFCQKYIETGNASEAYRLSYDVKRSTDKTIWESASKLLADPKVATRVNDLKEMHLKRHSVNVARVLQEYIRLSYLDIRKAFNEDGTLKPVHELDDDTAAAIASLEIEEKFVPGSDIKIGSIKKLKFSDKKGALDSLAKYLGMFIERHEHTGKDGGPIVTKEQRDAAVAAALAAES